MIDIKLRDYLIHQNEGQFALLWLTNQWPLATAPTYRAEAVSGGYSDLVIESQEGAVTLQSVSREVIQGVLESPFFVIFMSERGESQALELTQAFAP